MSDLSALQFSSPWWLLHPASVTAAAMAVILAACLKGIMSRPPGGSHALDGGLRFHVPG